MLGLLVTVLPREGQLCLEWFSSSPNASFHRAWRTGITVASFFIKNKIEIIVRAIPTL